MAEIRLCQMALLHRVTKFELYFSDLNITPDYGEFPSRVRDQSANDTIDIIDVYGHRTSFWCAGDDAHTPCSGGSRYLD